MYEHITEEMLDNAEHYERIRAMLEVSGRYLDSQLDEAASEIVLNRHYYPEYFQ